MRCFNVIENDIYVDQIWELARKAGFADLRLALWNGLSTLVTLREYESFLQPGGRNLTHEEQTRAWAGGCRLFFLHKRGARAVPDSRQSAGLAARLEVVLASRCITAGSPLRASVRVKNTGTTHWLPSDTEDEIGSVRLGAWLTPVGQKRQALPRFFLPRNDGKGVPPGEEVAFDIELPAIAEPGQYHLEFDMVSELVCWFGLFGSPIVGINVEVTP
jgi:hypothetical protein